MDMGVRRMLEDNYLFTPQTTCNSPLIAKKKKLLKKFLWKHSISPKQEGFCNYVFG